MGVVGAPIAFLLLERVSAVILSSLSALVKRLEKMAPSEPRATIVCEIWRLFRQLAFAEGPEREGGRIVALTDKAISKADGYDLTNWVAARLRAAAKPERNRKK